MSGLTSAYILGPGVYRHLPTSEYHALPGASASRLKYLEQSPLHLHDSATAQFKSTDSQEFGTAVHMAVFEPERFDAQYIVGPCDDRRVKAWKDFEATCPVDAITPKAHAEIIACRNAICAHDAAAWVLNKVTETELTVLWIDETSGMPCRARIDAIAPSLGATVEIKTAKDASISGFTRAVYQWRYYRQAAFYLNGANDQLVRDPAIATYLPQGRFTRHIIIAAESCRPWAVNVFPLRDDAIEAGRAEIGPLLRRWKQCEDTGVWPQESAEYSSELTDISLPPWAWKEIDGRLEDAA